jgi:chaperone required for assembly of F1-ATPase
MAAQLDDFSLAGLAFGASLFGSAVLALALQTGRLSGREAFDLSRLDQAFQEERWGIDDEAAARTDWMQQEALLLERWFLALKG